MLIIPPKISPKSTRLVSPILLRAELNHVLNADTGGFIINVMIKPIKSIPKRG